MYKVAICDDELQIRLQLKEYMERLVEEEGSKAAVHLYEALSNISDDKNGKEISVKTGRGTKWVQTHKIRCVEVQNHEIMDVFARFHADRSRVYANGHSMGACMCQRAILALPEYFTAGASTGGVLKGGFFGYFDTEGVKENCKMPLWMVMGENDYNGGTYDNPANGTKVNAEYWTKRNETQPVDDPLTYRNGLYYHKVYMNNQGVPMVQFTTVDYKPHCCTAQDSWFFYDQWFSKFSRNEDGTLVYMNGIEVK